MAAMTDTTSIVVSTVPATMGYHSYDSYDSTAMIAMLAMIAPYHAATTGALHLFALDAGEEDAGPLGGGGHLPLDLVQQVLLAPHEVGVRELRFVILPFQAPRIHAQHLQRNIGSNYRVFLLLVSPKFG